MTNSYCGKNCRFCVSRTSGKCMGCKPETIALLHDPTNEAFKLKCVRFLGLEKEAMDKGEVDIEMTQGYGDSAESEDVS